MKYSKHVISTPQSQPAFGHNMIANNAGGFGFEISKQKQLERFLALGTEGGTFYVGESKLTQNNAKSIVELIKANGVNVVNTLLEFRNRVPKQNTLLFVLALVATYGDAKAKAASYNAIATICRTPTQLATFLSNVQDMRGWSRGLRTGVARFYTEKDAAQLAYTITKYRQRNGWTNKDILRLAHPTARNEEQNKVFKYVVGKATAESTGQSLIMAFEAAQAATTPKELLAIMKAHPLTWEMLPTQFLNDKDVLTELSATMPYVATLRNLNRFTQAGLVDSRSGDVTKALTGRLLDPKVINDSGVHPIQILNALATYSSGRSARGSGTWTPSPAIVDALDEAFELSFGNVVPTGKNILLAVDVSGSMQAPVSNMALNAQQVAAAMMAITLKTEPNVDVTYFSDRLHPVTVGRRSSYEEILKSMGSRGGTNLSLPFEIASLSKTSYDAVVTYTDNETWVGQQHPVEAYKKLLRKTPQTKAVVVASTANNVDVLPSMPSTLGVAGFDSAVPSLISSFIKGDI
jgi:60 kDa SS-A/Ro ribonucleoprotein